MKITRINSDREVDTSVTSALDIVSKDGKRYRLSETNDGKIQLMAMDGNLSIDSVTSNVVDIESN